MLFLVRFCDLRIVLSLVEIDVICLRLSLCILLGVKVVVVVWVSVVV